MIEANSYEIENYIVYSNGVVYSKRKKRYLKEHKNNAGYWQYFIDNKWEKTHRLLAKYFIINPNHYTEVNHIDMNKDNNSLENLEWVTHQENMIKARELKQWCSSRASGFTCTDETKKEMSESAFNRWGKVKYLDIVYDNCKDASIKLDVNIRTISRWLASGKMVRLD